MKYSNEEKTSAGELAIEHLESAVDELAGIPEYRNIREDLKEKINELEQEKAVFEQAYLEECVQERAYENMEYERSVL